jgi:hypothetical protein
VATACRDPASEKKPRHTGRAQKTVPEPERVFTHLDRDKCGSGGNQALPPSGPDMTDLDLHGLQVDEVKRKSRFAGLRGVLDAAGKLQTRAAQARFRAARFDSAGSQ